MIKEDIVSLLENSFNNLGVEFERIDKTDCAYLVKVAANDLFKNIGTISFLYFWDEEENCLILYISNIYKFSKNNELLKIYEITESTIDKQKEVIYRICISTNTEIYKLNENTIKAQIDIALRDLNYGLRYMKLKGLIGNEK